MFDTVTATPAKCNDDEDDTLKLTNNGDTLVVLMIDEYDAPLTRAITGV
jgi:hypothetical protein